MSDTAADSDATSGGYFEHEAVASAVLPAEPKAYVGTPVFGDTERAALASLDVMIMLAQDKVALPGTKARDGWCDDRHLEYWLSGLSDAQIAMAATGLSAESEASVLDYGGGPARLTRHLAGALPQAKLYMSDSNPRNVALCNGTLSERVWALRTTPTPHLPFADGALDVILALAAFDKTQDESGWLLEFKRVLAPGGFLYTTVLDERSWAKLPAYSAAVDAGAKTNFQSYRQQTPEISDRTVYFSSKADDSDCVVFHPQSYVRRAWGRLFEVESMVSGAHGDHAGVLLRA